MTAEERNTKIINLKKDGYSYKQISIEVNIPIGTVKSILSRNDSMKGLKCKCKNCGKEIISIKGKKAKIFCSNDCRLEWWNSNRDKGNKIIYERTCPSCNKKFSTLDKDKKYCSHPCYIKDRFYKGSGING